MLVTRLLLSRRSLVLVLPCLIFSPALASAARGFASIRCVGDSIVTVPIDQPANRSTNHPSLHAPASIDHRLRRRRSSRMPPANPRIIALFDVDGTLTPARKVRKRWKKNSVDGVSVRGGSID